MNRNRNAIYSNCITDEYRKNGEEWNFCGEKTQQHFHTLHPYPARFIPQIPRQAILRWSKTGETVLDPFCGCGTTLLESILNERPAIGIDNNDIACLISRAKTAKYTNDDIMELQNFSSNILNIVKSQITDFWTPKYDSITYWFDENAIIDLGRIKTAIENLSNNARLLSSVVLSSIIVRVSYQYSDTRYVKTTYTYVPESAIKWFKAKLDDTIDRLKEIINLPRQDCIVHRGDSRNMYKIEDESIDLIVTSPPYLNAYDYHKYHRHRLHWVGGDIEFARNLEIGKHDFFTRPKAKPGPYFDDMKKCFSEFYRVLRPNGRALVVIGDAIVNHNPVSVGDKFVTICEEMDFTCENRYIRKIPGSKKSFNREARINEEHILLFNRT